ncbi:type IV pilin [Haloarcula marina]|uniref:type IV pilin n=1 Tax=Haloarcula marina TaxID=2961574 RepID=UPI0020B762D3|nr:type IV pilin N-terminal domain-containing protein [Halomicroarcula marina]
MELKRFFDDDDAVSPVIGVILMVAITVILAAVIATFVLGLGDQVSNTAPQASFSFDFENDASGDDSLTIVHDGGDTIRSEDLNIVVSGANVEGSDTDAGTYTGSTFDSVTDVSAGTSETIDDESQFSAISSVDLDLSPATVRVVYNADGTSATLGEWDGPDA